MASIIESYNYDIFISYRQKDNKGDKWVSEFVDALKDELESTFKEEISVYFDINPHDGLLETHDVDASLKEKLKCLVFIPIISRTYCDPKSFAWEHEFIAFVEQTSHDEFGLKVKLPNGNVANRVLPVRIHDLDIADIKLCESILNTVLRGIEFIYKEPGVNRPLTPKDSDEKNSNNTNYRNQINKVALAVREIITSIDQYEQKPEVVKKEISKPVSVPGKSNKTTIIAGSVILFASIILGLFLIPKLFKSSEEVEKSIAVLPFDNLSSDPEHTWFSDGITDVIINQLSKISDLRVFGRTSTLKYKESESKKSLSEIGEELGVNFLIDGTVHRQGNQIRIVVQLIRAINEDLLWSEIYVREYQDIFVIQSEIAQLIANELEVIITPEEKQLIERVPTANLTAYDFYQQAEENFLKFLSDRKDTTLIKNAENHYHKALDLDPSFAQAFTGLAKVYWEKNFWNEFFSENFLDSVIYFTNTALELDDQLAEAYLIRGNYFIVIADTTKALREYDRVLKLNPNSWEVYYAIGLHYITENHIKSIKNLLKAATLYHGPEYADLMKAISTSFAFAGFYEQSKQYWDKVLELNDDSLGYYNRLATNEGWQGYYQQSILYCRKALRIDSTVFDVLDRLAYNLIFEGEFDKSLEYYKRCEAMQRTLGDIVLNNMHRYGFIYSKNGLKKEASYYFQLQEDYCLQQIKLGRPSAISLYAYYDLAGVYAFRGEKEKAMENLRIFNQKKNYSNWMVTLINDDPLFDNIRNEPEFKQIVRDVEAKYQADHEIIRKWLKEQGML